MKTDVVIIGAGPGGGMAACRLAATGLKTIVLEQARLPRHKACGGGIADSTRGLFDWDLTPLIENQVTKKRSLYNYERERIARIAPFLMVDRSRFDAHLVERAVAAGNGTVELRDGFRVSRVEETAGGVSVHGENGERIQCDFLVAADGAFGVTARCLGLNQETSRGAAIEARVEVTPEVYEAERQAITFNYFCLPHGYGWVFPTSEGTLNCGVCAWAGRPHLPRAVDDFLARSFPPGAIRQVQTHGHVIPLYSGHRQIATRRVCLVGDAASLVDPISGEGIRFALESGALAADVIAEQAGAAGGADCRAYQSAIHEGIGQYLEHLRRFVQFIFLDAPEFFYQKFILEGVNYARVASRLEVGAGGQL